MRKIFISIPVVALASTVFLMPMTQQNVYAQNQTLPCNSVGSCYDQGYAYGQAHPGISCTEAQKEIQDDNYINYCAGISDGSGSTTNSQNNYQGTTPSSIGSQENFAGECNAIQGILVQPCSQLVNPDGSLTVPDGQTANTCIRNGIVLGLAGLALTGGTSLPEIISALHFLASRTGCDGVVNWNYLDFAQLNLLKQIFH